MKTNDPFKYLYVIAMLLCATAGFAQTPTKLYSQVYYHKLKPGHTFAEARAMENEFKKIHQYQANEGIMNGWYMLALDMTTNPNKDYDYITINTFSDPGYIDNPYSQATMEKVMGTDYQTKTSELYKRMNEVKSVAKFEIWEIAESALANPLPSPDKSPVWVVTNGKVKNDRYDEYAAWMKKMQPISQERINMGDGVVWTFSRLVLPSADEKMYDFSTVVQYPTMKAMLTDNKAEAAFKKVMPGVDSKEFTKPMTELRDRTRQEVYYLVEYAVKAPAEQAKK